ncbi:hypothetical protein EKK58_07350 [Candidatus Dependentiae bacterium]|nr:MAG: hypothetical protein EKK58_07350 [Candidatus Dependentiae bacterium]
MKHGESYILQHLNKGVITIKIHSTDHESITGEVVGIKREGSEPVRIGEKLSLRKMYISNCYQV